MNPGLFKANTIIVGTFFLIGLSFSAIQGEVNQEATETFGLAQIIYTVAGIYLVFAIVHTIIFACKIISKLENRREVSFGDYLNNMMLMLFFFVGIWFLQPKVKRLIARKEEVAC